MELNVRPLDMGYFGKNHEQYGIVLHIDQRNQTLTVLETTNSPHHNTVQMAMESFVVTRNINDMCVDAEAKYKEVKDTSKQHRPFMAQCGAQIKVQTRNKQSRNIAHQLFGATQTYSTTARNNPNYGLLRESILVQLLDMEIRHPECFNEIAAILDSSYDSHNRIVAVTAPGFAQTFHLTISVIGKQIIVHDASIRYETPKFPFASKVNHTTRPQITSPAMAMV